MGTTGETASKVALSLAGLGVVALLAFLVVPWAISTIAIGWLNEHFPPRSSLEAQASAIKNSAEGLNGIYNPNVAFTVSASTLTSLFNGAVNAISGVSPLKLDHLSVHPGGQQIRFTSDFSGQVASLGATVSGKRKAPSPSPPPTAELFSRRLSTASR